jgi:hypothetical protein
MSYPMIDDPARDFPPAANSEQATAMLDQILATPRQTPVPPRRSASVKRIAVGALLAAAAVTVALAAPMPWNNGHPSEAAAYTVQRNGDAVSVVVHWNQLSDPAKLQQALDAAGAPVQILTGTATHTAPSATIPECAKPYSGVPYSAAAVLWDSGRNAPDSSFVIHPAAFPTHGTLVIEVFFAAGSQHWASTLTFMAIGRVPTCAVPA